MEHLGAPEITVETVWRTILVTDARDSSKAYFSRADEALVRIERDRALFARIAAAHGGEEARDRGDGSMFAFSDPAAALRAAMMMQSEMARLNAALPEGALRLEHRMGIQMGSVKVATLAGEPVRRKLSGDIVVTAARLEGICHPGEVCFSNDVHRAVRGTIDHGFRSLDANLKGLDGPVRVWSTRLDRDWARPLTAQEEATKARQREERRLRERWEREAREGRRRRAALVGSAWAATLSLGWAAMSYATSQAGFDPMARMREALREPAAETSVVRIAVPERVEAPVVRHRAWVAVRAVTDARTPVRLAVVRAPVHRIPAPGVRSARSRVTALLRATLDEGRFEALAARLLELGLPMADYQGLVEHARRVEATRDWLQEGLEATQNELSPGVPLEPAVAGLTRILRVEDGAVVGLDERLLPAKISFLDLPPDALGELVRAVGQSDPTAAPEEPDAAVRSLAVLRRWAGR